MLPSPVKSRAGNEQGRHCAYPAHGESPRMLSGQGLLFPRHGPSLSSRSASGSYRAFTTSLRWTMLLPLLSPCSRTLLLATRSPEATAGKRCSIPAVPVLCGQETGHRLVFSSVTGEEGVEQAQPGRKEEPVWRPEMPGPGCGIWLRLSRRQRGVCAGRQFECPSTCRHRSCGTPSSDTGSGLLPDTEPQPWAPPAVLHLCRHLRTPRSDSPAKVHQTCEPALGVHAPGMGVCSPAQPMCQGHLEEPFAAGSALGGAGSLRPRRDKLWGPANHLRKRCLLTRAP